MPSLTLNAKRLTTNANRLLIAYCLLLIAVLLSGCSAVGFQKFAALQVTSTPQASIFLDGKHLGQTPFYSNQLKNGNYSLKITTTDATYLDEIELSSGTLTVVNRDLSFNFMAQAGETLSLKSGFKGVMITSLPSEADITIDGRYVGKTPLQNTDISEGEHKVLATRQGYIDREFSIKTLAGYQVVAEVILASKIAKGLAININAPEASSPAKGESVKTQSTVNVKKEPDKLAQDIGKIKAGEQLDLIGQNQTWYQVVFEGKLGWIPKETASKL
ncbi:hypothetical protein A3A60_03200 [Candidatus Curtissbacteria bacterium RIFCSPLOWO2_01_FULL_42_26]|uniref:SH3b domain-containing protein n=1 Tax=Candidatus Curtissbacteria bacterium RIFCSPLOWO2_01_FULL_42_26 TaxID=1797729 RepID=A0A1F5I2A4_9BACT|nr:MAG: hypothetical protein A3A60_03200 [Candidatus Curtissbacteria bacterium RIFCSPLOWO2_01_FULL_42_26]